ncbi:MAG: hypothetical protein AB8U48_03810 [Anaplasma ovis]
MHVLAAAFFFSVEKILHPELGVAEDEQGVDVGNQERESREEPGVPAARIHFHMSHKERVVVGCMVFLGIVLGSLLMHGAVTSIQEGSTLFFIMNIGGFIGIIAIAALIWNSVALARMRRRGLAQSDQVALQGMDHEAAAGSNEELPPTNIGNAELGDDTTGVKMRARE